MSQWTGGEVIEGLTVDGRDIRAAVVNEHAARAAAGVTMALGTVAFVYAYFEAIYWPLQVVSTFFFIEFLVRVTAGLKRSPVGMLGAWLTQRQTPEWVSAKPKRFAWTLGLGMSGAMMVITNSGVRGFLPRTICALCLVLMWLESSLGLCLGCEIHGFLVRRNLTTKDAAFEICANGACEIPARQGAAATG